MAIIRVRDTAGQAIPLMNLRLSLGTQPSEAAYDDRFTDLAGNTAWPVVLPSADGYTLYANRANLKPDYGTASLHVQDFHGDIDLTVPHDLSRIVVQGRDFIRTSNGERYQVIGCTDLMLAWRYDIEGAEAIKPVLAQRGQCGFNNLRVLWQKDINNTGTSPWLMPTSKMVPFLTLCAEYGFYIEGVILADCQVCNPTVAAQQARVSVQRSATVGIDSLIEQLGNEFSKNFFDPRNFTKPTDRLAANASNIEGGPDAPYWDFFCFSGQRAPLNHAIREYGPIEFIYGDAGTYGGGVPAICDEGMKPGINSSDPRDFERAGAQARSGNGGRFHSFSGTGGNSCLFDNLEKACAEAFVRGLR